MEDWGKTFRTNVMGPYFVTVGFLKLLGKGTRTVSQGSQVSGLTRRGWEEMGEGKGDGWG